LLIARADGVPIGVAYVSFVWSLEHGGLSAWLEELYVVPERRDGGTGTALVHAVKGVCRAHGCAAIDLEIEESQARAVSLYEREGFERHTRTRWVRKIGRDSIP
jgi:GNAT superfamily N-acetyltransferase